MELIIELFVEVVGQFLLEVVAEAGFRGVGRLLSNRFVRAMLGAVTTLGIGLGAGYWWGVRLTEQGRTEPPSSMWVSIALAGVFVTLALIQALRHRDDAPNSTAEPPQGVGPRLSPWRWSAERLLGFAALNASVAIGIAIGFRPLAAG